MLPNTGGADLPGLRVEQQPSYTFGLDIERSRVRGMADGLDAVRQAVYLILSTERYAYPIYSRRYGVELVELIGKPKDYAMSEAKRRITAALMQDDRITGLSGWAFEPGKKILLVRFTVHSIFGDTDTSVEVTV